jgi:nicotinate-nucleotide adenylyltransferase
MGGTFNPIHFGHLVTAEEALNQFKLGKIIFVPSGHPPHKRPRPVLPPEDRYQMTAIATASNPHFEVSRIEVDREGPSYAIDTVKELMRVYGPKAEIYFITGADAILEILTWRDAERLYGLCKFIAATRPGYSLKKFRELHLLPENHWKTKKPDVYFMEVPALAISSTDIRKRVKENRPIRYLLPEGVAEYIYKHRLYRE